MSSPSSWDTSYTGPNDRYAGHGCKVPRLELDSLAMSHCIFITMRSSSHQHPGKGVSFCILPMRGWNVVGHIGIKMRVHYSTYLSNNFYFQFLIG